MCASKEWRILDFIISQKLCLCSPFRYTSRDNIARVQSQRTWQTWTCTPRLQLPSKLCLMSLGLTEEFLRTFSSLLLSLHLKWPLCIRYWCVVLICYRFCSFSQMLNERGYERDTNCSGMLRTSSRLVRAEHMHLPCCICDHTNELAAEWPDPPTLI